MVDYSSLYGYGTSPASLSSGLASPLQIASTAPIKVIPDNTLMPVPKIPGAEDNDGGFGLNFDTAKLGLSGLATLGNLYAAFQANSLAKKQFDFTKKVTNANLANSIQAYNTTLEDRYSTRGKVEGTSDADVAASIEANRLKDVKL